MSQIKWIELVSFHKLKDQSLCANYSRTMHLKLIEYLCISCEVLFDILVFVKLTE